MIRAASNPVTFMLLCAALLACSSGGGGGGSSGSAAGGAANGGTAANGSGGGAGVSGSSSSGATGGASAAGGASGSAGSSGGAGASGAGAGGASGAGAGGSSGGGTGGFDDPPPGEVAVDTTPGRWRTALDAATGRFQILSPEGAPTVLRGVSLTGAETGTRETQAGAGFWLYSSNVAPEATNAPTVLRNVVKTIVDDWNANVVRIPICGSAWTQNYVVRDWGNQQVATYKDWVDFAVQEARSRGAVVIIDLHLWAIAKKSHGGDADRGTFASNGETRNYADYEDGCTGTNMVGGKDSCAPKDWYTDDPMVWQCAIANADGVTMHNAYKNKDHISAMWADIATKYKGDSGVWFELFNEPYVRKAGAPFPADGENDEEANYPWDLWAEFMNDSIKAIRDEAQAPNIVIVNGLDWGYDFGPDVGPIARPSVHLPWLSTYPNIVYAFHPYQHGACCGQIGASGSDMSVSDPYQSAFCSYYPGGGTWGEPSGTSLPAGKSCTNKGYAETQDKKMPPCTWVAAAWNPATDAMGLCAGNRAICGPKTQAECEAVDITSPDAGGWSKHVLPMAKYGPLIATEYGSFDCSSPYVTTLLSYMNELGISYTAWALWPQNSGGPAGLGSCGYPAVMTPVADPGDFRQCLDAGACSTLMQPLPWAGKATFDDIARN